MSDGRTILFIRHGATKLNNDDISVDRIRGWKDIPLSEDGRTEARILAKKLKDNPPDCIVTSDLKRAADTAREISKETGVPVEWETKAFRPWDVGIYAGEKSAVAVPILARYAEHHPDEKIPQGESFNSFKMRFFKGLDAALDRFPGTIAIVSHHRDERLLKAWKAEGFPANGDIKISVFNQKGEFTGSADRIEIPEERLDEVVGEKPASRMRKLIKRSNYYGRKLHPERD